MKKNCIIVIIFLLFAGFGCGPRYHAPIYPVNDPYGRQFQNEVSNILEENVHTEEQRARNDAHVGVYRPPLPNSWNYQYLYPAYYSAWRREQARIQQKNRRDYERWAGHQAIEDARRMYGVPPPPPPPTNTIPPPPPN